MTTLLAIWAAVVVVSFLVVWRTLALGSRVAKALGLSRWDRNMARRTLFRGVVNGPEEAAPLVARYRGEVLAMNALILIAACWFLGSPVLVLVALVGVVGLLSEPLDVAKVDG